jgi:hypothetical protein
MTDGQETPKRTHPLVWVAVGCAGVIMLGAFVLVVGSYFVFNAVKDVAEEVEDQPVVAAARLIAATNPEIELIEADEENRVVVFRNTKTDEEYTIDFEDIEEGKFSFFSDDESFTLELDSDEDDSGTLTITTEDGTTRFGAGAHIGDIPSWVPVYPGTTPEGTYSSESPEGRSGAYTIETEDELDLVVDFYISELEEQGLEIVNQARSKEGAFLTAQSPDDDLTMNLGASIENGKTKVVINFAEQ